MHNKWFDRFITLCICVNSVLLASKQYDTNYDADYESSWNDLLENLDLVFTIIFLLECIIKVAAMGFYRHKGSYLKDYWNWIDFVIVVISVISLSPAANQDSLKAFRTARVLRPLRSVNASKSMKMLIQTFLQSIPGLLNVQIALAFMFSIFAIFGVNFFVGKQYQFCRMTEAPIDDGVNPIFWPINEDAPYLCSSDDMCSGFPNKLHSAQDSTAIAKCGDVYTEYGLDPRTVD